MQSTLSKIIEFVNNNDVSNYKVLYGINDIDFLITVFINVNLQKLSKPDLDKLTNAAYYIRASDMQLNKVNNALKSLGRKCVQDVRRKQKCIEFNPKVINLKMNATTFVPKYMKIINRIEKNIERKDLLTNLNDNDLYNILKYANIIIIIKLSDNDLLRLLNCKKCKELTKEYQYLLSIVSSKYHDMMFTKNMNESLRNPTLFGMKIEFNTSEDVYDYDFQTCDGYNIDRIINIMK